MEDLENFLHHFISIVSVGAERVDQIGEESEEERERATVYESSERADRHESVVERVGESEELGETHRSDRVGFLLSSIVVVVVSVRRSFHGRRCSVFGRRRGGRRSRELKALHFGPFPVLDRLYLRRILL